jgi:hypothetical protein
LGVKYRDTQTGIEGTATAVTFYQFGCERVALEAVIAGKIEEYGFDAPRLRTVETDQPVRQHRTGGDRSPVSRPGKVAR